MNSCSVYHIRVLILVLLALPGLSFTKAGMSSRGNICKTYYQSDTLNKAEEKKGSVALKINPLQVLACEFPFAVEISRAKPWSLQLQVGYIFKGPGWHGIFSSSSGDTENGLLSYRISPYNNDGGFNVKLEFRKYRKPWNINKKVRISSFYYAPQVMYKYTYYKDQVHDHVLSSGQFSYDQAESKNSSVFGLGIMLGYQNYSDRLLIDIYTGCGFRLRTMKIAMDGVYLSYNGFTLPATTQNISSFYPFLNLGIRIGFKLKSFN